jgi:hypothetical protein
MRDKKTGFLMMKKVDSEIINGMRNHKWNGCVCPGCKTGN